MPNQNQAQNVVVQAQVVASQQTQAAVQQQQQVVSDIDALKQKLNDLESELSGGLKPNMGDVGNLFAAIVKKLDLLAQAQAQLVAAQSDLGAANIRLAQAQAANADLTAKLAQTPTSTAGTTSGGAVQKTKDGTIVVTAPAAAGIALGAAIVSAGAAWWAKGAWDKHQAKAKEIEGSEEPAKKRMKK